MDAQRMAANADGETYLRYRAGLLPSAPQQVARERCDAAAQLQRNLAAAGICLAA